MSITISKFDDQARGYFDGGKIKERKPISFESPIKGVSTLFYWAIAYSDEGGLIAPHPHKGFEILSYVIEGALEHEDSTEEGEWVKLEAGGMQVIRAGNGITHAERFAPGTKMFQIWLDPDFRLSLQRPASYTNYDSEDFEVEDFKGMKRIDFCGDESPMWISTKVQMDRFDFGKGSYSLDIPKSNIFSAVVMSGKITVDGEVLNPGDLVQVVDESSIDFTATEKASIFVIYTPTSAGYRTYTDQLQLSS